MSGIFGMINLSRCPFNPEKIARAWKRIEHRGRDELALWVDGTEMRGKSAEKLAGRIPENFRVLIAQNTLRTTLQARSLSSGHTKIIACDGEVFNLRELGYEKADFALFERDLRKVNGIYACCACDLKRNVLEVFRDPLGVNPLCYIRGKNFFAFASEAKALRVFAENSEIEHLNPRKILHLSLSTGKICTSRHPVKINLFPKIFTKNYEKLEELIFRAVEVQTRRLKKFGIMFSGGVDSALLARICQKLERKFTCYCAGVEGSEDLETARRVADEFGMKLREVVVSEDEMEHAIKRVARAIETNDFVQVSVALPFYFASLRSAKDENRVIFSGLGSEELFAGYYKYRKLASLPRALHQRCARDVENLYAKDLYRDNCTVASNAQELRVPFLDVQLVNFAMRISPEVKVFNGTEKYVLRRVAERYLGEFAWRRKRASQYGSGAAKLIEKLARKKGFKRKSDFVKFIVREN